MYYYKQDYGMGARTTNPANNAQIATSSVINEAGVNGVYADMQVVLSSTVNAAFKIQVWNGTTEVGGIYRYVLANTTEMDPFIIAFPLTNGWSVRILCDGTIVGTVQATIYLGFINTF